MGWSVPSSFKFPLSFLHSLESGNRDDLMIVKETQRGEDDNVKAEPKQKGSNPTERVEESHEEEIVKDDLDELDPRVDRETDLKVSQVGDDRRTEEAEDACVDGVLAQGSGAQLT